MLTATRRPFTAWAKMSAAAASAERITWAYTRRGDSGIAVPQASGDDVNRNAREQQGRGCRGSRRFGAAASLAPFRTTALRAWLHRNRPQPVPAVTVDGATPHEQDQAVTFAAGGPVARQEIAAEDRSHQCRNAAHCPGRPSGVKGAPAARRQAMGGKRPPLPPETSTAPADLTVRARPEARPEMRAANLRSPPAVREVGIEGISQHRACWSIITQHVEGILIRVGSAGEIVTPKLRESVHELAATLKETGYSVDVKEPEQKQSPGLGFLGANNVEALGLPRRFHDEVRARVPEAGSLPEPAPVGPPILF